MPSFSKSCLYFYATFKLLSVLGFLISLYLVQSAIAADEKLPLCTGKDIVAQLAIDDPSALQDLKTQAEKIVNSQARLWRISKPGIPDSWLFGTMHLTDIRIIKLPLAAQNAFNLSHTVILENIETLDKEKAQKTMRELAPLTMLLDGTTVESALDAKAKTALRDALLDRSIPYPIAIRMQPWLLATMVAVPACELTAKKAGHPVLDALLAQRAKNENKTLIGLETIEEQFTAISSLPREFHEKSLVETLKLGRTIDDVMETMKRLYIKGEIGMILPLMRHISPATTSSSGFADFQEKLVVNRNDTMAKRASQHLGVGGAFIAVGALHLPDDTGLVELLRQQGFSLEAIETNSIAG